MPEYDVYCKLKPADSTPQEEICSCQSQFPFVLCYAFTENPIRCMACNLEVLPENLPFTSSLIGEIASWRGFYRCFFDLWLDSGEFEEWAYQELSDSQSVVNQRAYELCLHISEIRQCYFWWFQDIERDAVIALITCPRCHGDLEKKIDRFVCEECSLLIAN